MTEPSIQRLYVIQNEFGCIKVGRSLDPKERRWALRQSEKCAVELIAITDSAGEDEEAILHKLRDHRLEGEWFSGNEASRRAVERIFSINPSAWKYEHDQDAADQWLALLRSLRAVASSRRDMGRTVARLKSADGPHYFLDGDIFRSLHLALTGERLMVQSSDIEGRRLAVWIDRTSGKTGTVPTYTDSVEQALLAWPDNLRPEQWNGTAIDCCIAALYAVQSTILAHKLRRAASV